MTSYLIKKINNKQYGYKNSLNKKNQITAYKNVLQHKWLCVK